MTQIPTRQNMLKMQFHIPEFDKTTYDVTTLWEPKIEAMLDNNLDFYP